MENLCQLIDMPEADPTVEIHARQTIRELLAARGLLARRKRVYLVSYPRSGNTLARQYFSLLQGRPQFSVYDGDVVGSTNDALTRSLDDIEIIKSHQMPSDDGAMIYLVRDGRNATLSFLYMTFLFGGHQFSELADVYDGIRHLDRTEGSWADHVVRAVAESERRHTLFMRYEDLVSSPKPTLERTACFLSAEVAAEALDECVRRQKESDAYARNPYNGYLYKPARNSIYDILKRHRRDDYWRYIFDDRSKRYFHQRDGTKWLLHFGYERSADWWEGESA